jgi:ribosome-binding protein aMBF1 (putative translation factor)
MTKQVIVYISGAHEYVDLKGYRKAILDYGQANGLGELRSDMYQEEVVAGDVLAQCIKSAQSGAAFITNSLTSFGVKPSEQRAHVITLIGKGCDVHILGLGRIDSYLHVLKEAWSAAGAMEKQLSELEADYAEREQQLRDRMAAFEDKLVARMSAVVGHSGVKEFYSNGGSAPEPEPEVTDPTALRVRELREAKQWSQADLAEKAGTSKSMIQRIESQGRGSDLGKVMSVLEHTP